MTDSWRSPVNVTLSVLASVCEVRTVKLRVGIAETRHTPSLPNRTDACPPADWMVCTPDPPSPQSLAPLGPVPPVAGFVVFDGEGEGRGVVRVAVGRGDGFEVGFPMLGDGLGFGELLDGDGFPEAEEKTVGAERATGGVGLVDPTTKWTVRITAVTLTAVQESHMSR